MLKSFFYLILNASNSESINISQGIDVFCVLVETTYASLSPIFCDLHTSEAPVTPPLTPGVLDLPVVLQALLVSKTALRLRLTSVVPLGYRALKFLFEIIIITLPVVTESVANHNNNVVQRILTFVSSDDTRFVEHKSFWGGMNRGCDGLDFDPVKHLLKAG